MAKKSEPKKVVNPLFEKRPKNFGIGELSKHFVNAVNVCHVCQEKFYWGAGGEISCRINLPRCFEYDSSIFCLWHVILVEKYVVVSEKWFRSAPPVVWVRDSLD